MLIAHDTKASIFPSGEIAGSMTSVANPGRRFGVSVT
jgi:hypothetical protein